MTRAWDKPNADGVKAKGLEERVVRFRDTRE